MSELGDMSELHCTICGRPIARPQIFRIKGGKRSGALDGSAAICPTDCRRPRRS